MPQSYHVPGSRFQVALYRSRPWPRTSAGAVSVSVHGMHVWARFLVVAVVSAVGVPVVGCGPARDGEPGGLGERLAIASVVSLGEVDGGVVGVAVGESGVWAAKNHADGCSGAVVRIGVDGDAVEATAPIRMGHVSDVAVGPGAVWAVGGVCTGDGTLADAALFRVDPSRAEVVATVVLPDADEAVADRVAVGEGGVWVTQAYPGRSSGQVVRVDPDTNEVAARIPLDAPPGDIEVGAGAVWVLGDPRYTDASRGGASLLRIDPDGDAVAAILERERLRFIGAGIVPPALAVGDDAVWAVSQTLRTGSEAGRSVAIRVDASSNEVSRHRLAMGRFFPFAVADDRVWFVGSHDAHTTVSRLDTGTLEVVDSTGRLQAVAGEAAYDPATRTAWIADAAGDTVTRVDLR